MKPTNRDVVFFGASYATKEYPPESGRACVLFRYQGKYYVVPLDADGNLAYDREAEAEPYLS
jgi:hypothetical protein